jgi:hypothetical protein
MKIEILNISNNTKITNAGIKRLTNLSSVSLIENKTITNGIKELTYSKTSSS